MPKFPGTPVDNRELKRGKIFTASYAPRLRYRWDMVRNGRTLMEGLDIVTLDPLSGLIARVDGFFGQPTPIHENESGVPSRLRAPEVGV